MSIDTIGTDHHQIIKFLLLVKSGITSGEWARMTGSTKLTTRISELRRDGVEFLAVKEDGEKRKNQYTRYFLKSTAGYIR